MKKSLTLAVLSLCATSSVFAASDVPQEPQPTLYLSTYDMSGKTPTDLGKKDISRSAKAHQLCWVANGNFAKQITVTEVFKSPEKTTFAVSENPNAVKVSEDKKTHTITTTRDALNQGKTVVNCWKFDEKDPRGQYTIQVQVGEIVYDPLTFNVVK